MLCETPRLHIYMKALGVDVLISAPQKGWSSSPCAGLVMLSDAALAEMENTQSSSFAADLKKWHQIMGAYLNGGHAYHATMPTDSLTRFRDMINETFEFGLENARDAQWELGNKVRALLAEKGFVSVAHPDFAAPGVVVSYTGEDAIHKGAAFLQQGMQTAAGVPLQCEEPESFKTFRVGLFGLDKLKNVDATVETLKGVLEKL